MNKVILALVVIFSASNAFANGPDATFTKTNLSYWMSGADDVVIGRLKEQCNAQDQALANQTAQQLALNDCNASPEGYRCFVASAVITFNGPLSEEIQQRYGLQRNPFTLNTWHGCESTATVFGFR